MCIYYLKLEKIGKSLWPVVSLSGCRSRWPALRRRCRCRRVGSSQWVYGCMQQTWCPLRLLSDTLDVFNMSFCQFVNSVRKRISQQSGEQKDC